jgi:integrase
MRIYGYQLEKYLFPALGSMPLRDIHRAQIEACLSGLKRKGHATSTLRSVRATFSTVLQSAVERGYIEKNPAHGIRIREADTKKEWRFYSPAAIRRLLAFLTEPCRTVVSIAVLTGLRIGEILGLVGSVSICCAARSRLQRHTRAGSSVHRRRRAVIV